MNNIILNDEKNQIDFLIKLKIKQLTNVSLFKFNEDVVLKYLNCSSDFILNNFANIFTLESFSQTSVLRCENRFCNICNFIKAKNLVVKIVKELERIEKEENKEFIFITLTSPNCKFQDLRQTIQNMNKAFRNLSNHKLFKANFNHYIKTLEFTFKKDEANPHFHIILSVSKDYFKKTNKNYITTEKLSALWTSAFNNDAKKNYVVDMRKIKQNKKQNKSVVQSAVTELAKYVVKSNDLKKLNVQKMQIIYNQLVNLRNITTSQNIKLSNKSEEKIDKNSYAILDSLIYKFMFEDKKYELKEHNVYDVDIAKLRANYISDEQENNIIFKNERQKIRDELENIRQNFREKFLKNN